jgi:crossover junction endodeoxyribonuclease RusA
VSIRITLPVPPSANNYWRHDRGRTHRTHEADQYRRTVSLLCSIEGIEPYAGNVCLSIDVYRPAKRGDLDNFLKVAIDSLRGYAYVDDNQIVELHAGRFDDKADPRVVVVISEVGG